MSFHKHLARPATALVVAAVAVALFARPATALSIGLLGIPSEHQISRGETSSPSGLLFVENAGQWPEAARFQVWGSPAGVGTTWLTEDAIWITVAGGRPHKVPKRSGVEVSGSEAFAGGPANLHSASLRDFVQPKTLPPATLQPATLTALKLTFPGSNPDVRIEPNNPLTTTVNYFLGNGPGEWYPAVQVYGGVRYTDLYPGVDLVLGKADTFWRLEAVPAAEANPVRLRIEGADGATLTTDGALRLTTDVGDLDLALPISNTGLQVEVIDPSGQAISFGQHASDPRPESFQRLDSHTPVDNPAALSFSTFLSGSVMESVSALASSSAGQATVAGQTWSPDFPTTPGAFDPDLNGSSDAFVARLSAGGNTLVYATFFGGHANDAAEDIAVDDIDRATVTGWTCSPDFPITPNAFDLDYNGECDAFIFQLNTDGRALLYSTFLGGNSWDSVFAVSLDHAGWAIVAGESRSADFPTTSNAFDTSYSGGNSDAFVARLSADGSTLVYSTFIGGGADDIAEAIVGDSAGRMTVAGWTWSPDFPTTPGAFDPDLNGEDDVFVARLSADGSSLVYGTFLGGSQWDAARALVEDDAGRVYVAGGTYSSDFPSSAGSFDPGFNGAGDAFVTCLSADGSSMVYSTFLGGSAADTAWAIGLSGVGQATISGQTYSADFPTIPDAFATGLMGGHYSDAFISRLSADGSVLTYGTFLGGTDHDGAMDIAMSGANRALIAGDTLSADFPTTPDSFEPVYNGSYQAATVSALDLYTPRVVVTIERPAAWSIVTGTVILSGYAIDLNSSAGTGIDKVSFYLDGPFGTGVNLGQATYGLARPDVAAHFGVRFGPSGWEFAWDTSDLVPGLHRLYLYAHRTADTLWTVPCIRPLIVSGDYDAWLPLTPLASD